MMVYEKANVWDLLCYASNEPSEQAILTAEHMHFIEGACAYRQSFERRYAR